MPPSPVSNVHKGHIFQRSPHPQEQSLQGTKGPPNAPAPPTRTHSTSISQPTEVRKVRAPSAEPSEEGEVSREASTVHSSRRNSIDQSVCMESEADQNATSEPASPEYEPAEPVELGEPEAQEELEEDDLEQLDVPDAPKYPGSFGRYRKFLFMKTLTKVTRCHRPSACSFRLTRQVRAVWWFS